MQKLSGIQFFFFLSLYSRQEQQVADLSVLVPQLFWLGILLQQHLCLTIVLLFTYSYSKKRYNIAPKKETPTLDPSLNEQLSILCVYRSQWTSSTMFLIEEFTGILPSITQEKSSSGRGDLSLVIYSKLYTTVVEYCPLYTQGPASS